MKVNKKKSDEDEKVKQKWKPEGKVKPKWKAVVKMTEYGTPQQDC